MNKVILMKGSWKNMECQCPNSVITVALFSFNIKIDQIEFVNRKKK